MRRLLSLALVALLTACGGGEDDPSEVIKPTSLLVIGNSISYVPPGGTAQSGAFAGGWGVAASSQDKDYVHLVAAAQNLPVKVENHATLEIDPSAPVPSWGVTPSTVVVVQLGDNTLPAKYAEILSRFKGAHTLVCVSTWWSYTNRDAVIQRECATAGGRYVWIGDLWTRRLDDVGAYADPTVDAHPHDWGMAEIAARVNAALR